MFKKAFDIFRSARHRIGEAHCLLHLGAISIEEDCHKDAVVLLSRAKSIYIELLDRENELICEELISASKDHLIS